LPKFDPKVECLQRIFGIGLMVKSWINDQKLATGNLPYPHPIVGNVDFSENYFHQLWPPKMMRMKGVFDFDPKQV